MCYGKFNVAQTDLPIGFATRRVSRRSLMPNRGNTGSIDRLLDGFFYRLHQQKQTGGLVTTQPLTQRRYSQGTTMLSLAPAGCVEGLLTEMIQVAAQGGKKVKKGFR